MSEFFVGYLDVPPRLARFLRALVAALVLLFVAIPLLLLRGQGSFASSTFEFGNIRLFEGTIRAHPYPALLVSRPGSESAGVSQYLLVAAGKHGAEEWVTPFEGRAVRLRGQLIYRDAGTMIEIEPGSIVTAAAESRLDPPVRDLGAATLTGEIVDSKCYLGVMNPGQGKVHRDCAARCLSGGLPPMFIDIGDGTQYLLAGTDGRALKPDALREFVAEPLTLHGRILQKGDQKFLWVDPGTLRHTAESGHSR